MMITIKQYQDLCSLDSGSTTEYNLMFADILKLDKNMNQSDLEKYKKEFFENIVKSKKHHKYIKLGKRWYKVDRELYKMSLLQWADFDTSMKLIKQKKFYEIMHNIISCFIRPCRLYKWFPKKYKQDNKLPDIVRNKLDFRVAVELTNFFFSIYDDFYDTFSHRLFRRIGKESMGDNQRLNEIYNDYGWYLTILNLSNDNIFDFEKVMNIDMGSVISYLELSKANQEISHIRNEQLKKNINKNG